MNCPYPDCKHPKIIPPKIGELRPHGYCTKCERKSRASVSYIGNKPVVTGYSPLGYKKPNSKNNKVQLRISDVEIKAVNEGAKKIVFVGKKPRIVENNE